MPLPRRRGRELLDLPDLDPRLLAGSLAHVAAVNRWLGGRRALRRAAAPFLHQGARVLDIGTGSGDLPRYLAAHARDRRTAISITAVDLHPQIRTLAAGQSRAWPEIDVAAADARALPFAPASFDLALLSLVLHHLDDDVAVQALREAARVARVVIVNELHRTRLNYAGALLLAHTLWDRNPITRHDGPLSVLQAYRPDELVQLARAAGLEVLEVRRHWFQRLVLLAAAPAGTYGASPGHPDR